MHQCSFITPVLLGFNIEGGPEVEHKRGHLNNEADAQSSFNPLMYPIFSIIRSHSQRVSVVKDAAKDNQKHEPKHHILIVSLLLNIFQQKPKVKHFCRIQKQIKVVLVLTQATLRLLTKLVVL